MNTIDRMIRPLILALGLLSLAGCYTVPITGRTAFIVVPQGEEISLGVSAYDEAKSNTPVSRDRALQTRVEMVGKRIAAVSDFPDWKWEFTVFDDPKTPNAWCLPGGKIAVYTGLMPYVTSDAELAAVMAHEVSHAIARHGAERMSQQMIIEAGAQAITATASQKNLEAYKVAYGVGSQLFVSLPHSRSQEYESDRMGLIYMARAGYDPNAALTFWERFKQASAGKTPPEFLSTHPADDNRIAQIKELLPEAEKVYEQSAKAN